MGVGKRAKKGKKGDEAEGFNIYEFVGNEIS